MTKKQWIEYFQNHECAILSYCNYHGKCNPENKRIKTCTMKVQEGMFIVFIDTKRNQWIGAASRAINLINPESSYAKRGKYIPRQISL